MRPLIFLFGAAVAAAALPASAEDGGAMFASNCSACHQDRGQGIAGAFPALAGNAFVQGPADQVAKTVLNGRGGMPAFGGDLNDGQIAAILSFVRQAWGNASGAIAEAQVAAVRITDGGESHSSQLQAH